MWRKARGPVACGHTLVTSALRSSATMPPPQTPLRRVSYHSLYRRSLSASRNSALGASVSDPSAPSCLAFLGPAFAEFTDEVETLAEHAQRTAELDQTLREFNEGFAAYLYALEMNAFTTWWPQVRQSGRFMGAQAEMKCILRHQPKIALYSLKSVQVCAKQLIFILHIELNLCRGGYSSRRRSCPPSCPPIISASTQTHPYTFDRRFCGPDLCRRRSILWHR